jgi:Mrp family chromosome partitioning ATPase
VAGIYLAADNENASVVELKQTAIDVKQPQVARVAADILKEKPADLKRFVAPLKVNVIEESLTIRLSRVHPVKAYAERYVRAFAQALQKTKLASLNAQYVTDVQQLSDARDEASDALLAFQLENPTADLDPSLRARETVLEQRLENAENDLLSLQATPVANPYRIQDADETTLVAQTKLELPSSRPVRAVLALMLGAILGVALAAFIEKLNPRVDSPSDAERIVGAPVLAMVPIMKGKRRAILGRANLAEFSGPFAESFRAMRSHLDFRSAAEGLDGPPRVMIVSSVPNEGKTTSTAFLALSYCEVGREVVVIGGDFRRPAVHRLFGVPHSPGLSSRLLADEGMETSEDLVKSIVTRDELTGVRVVPSGPGTDRVTGLLSDLSVVSNAARSAGCTVVIDTAPVMVANDAIDFLPIVDWVVLVVRLGRTTERALRQTVSSLELNDAKIAGCIMVGSLESSDAKRYYYSYYKMDSEQSELADRQIAESRARMGMPPSGPNGSAAPDREDVPAEHP